VATDDSGVAVEYYFSSQTATDSGWTSNRTYVANNLVADTEYSWQVKARDASGNETQNSAALSARTKPDQPTPEPHIASETRYEVYRETSLNKQNRWKSNTLVATLAADSTSYSESPGTGQFRYYIRSINGAGGTDSARVQVTIATACKGRGKKCR